MTKIQPLTGNSIERAFVNSVPINPYNTNLSADLDELSQDQLAELLKRRREKLNPVLIRSKEKQGKGFFKKD